LLKLDEISNKWSNALSIYPEKYISDSIKWETTIKIKWYTPWKFEESFRIEINKWWEDYIDTWETGKYIIKTIPKFNSFKKPLIWEFEIIKWWTIPEIWKIQEYRIKLIKENSNNLNIDNNSVWIINISENTIQNNIVWHVWNWDLSNIDNSFWNDLSNNLWFIWKIDANENILKSPVITSNDLEISYKLGWKDIKYHLGNFISVGGCNIETLWLKVIWVLQWTWKASITWQKSNFSDLSKLKIRSQIRKSAYISIKNRISDKTKNINDIIYVKWSINYSEVKWYLKENDTIIVKDWNLIIDEDINKNIWIIIIKDNYNVEYDYENIWNIYVENGVSNIKAVIYADWVFRSANSDWKSYSDNELNKQLNLYWSLFTRNTIWWAVKANLDYTLPGWKVINNFDLAQVYDLNYTRKVPKTCDWNDKNDYSFIIKYNPSIQNNPPKLFGK
jgi:hypothetical protein